MELWGTIILCSIIPVMMLITGLFAKMGLPKRVNWVVGYRTTLSCKNQDTWAFAHKHLGRSWSFIGVILFILSIGFLLLLHFADIEVYAEIVIPITMITQLVVMSLMIIPTEVALRKEFDKNGIRKQKQD